MHPDVIFADEAQISIPQRSDLNGPPHRRDPGHLLISIPQRSDLNDRDYQGALYTVKDFHSATVRFESMIAKDFGGEPNFHTATVRFEFRFKVVRLKEGFPFRNGPI